MRMELLGITNEGLDVIRQRLIRFSISARYLEKSWSIITQYIRNLQISGKPMIQLGEKH
jgi:hypothetical protein